MNTATVTVSTDPGRAFAARADELAQWTMKLVNRADAWGQYLPLNARVNGTAITAKGKLTEDIIRRHYIGADQSDLIGLHAIAPEGTCRWFSVDLDAHGKPAPENWPAALRIIDRLESHELHTLVEKSNDTDGFHISVLLDGPLASDVVFRFAQHIIADWQELGLKEKPETFPKQAQLNGDGYGNWLRLPGRHHTRNHWSQVWGGDAWYEGEDAIDLILNCPVSSSAKVAELAPPAPSRPSPAHTNRVDQQTDDNRVKRAAAYIDTIPGAISGQHGHDTTFTVACECFRFGLTEYEAWAELKHFNNRCTPAWNEKDLRHKLDDARLKVESDGEFSVRLREDHKSNGRGSRQQDATEAPDPPNVDAMTPIKLGELWKAYPELRRYIIDGLLREGQVGNIISTSKSYKTYLVLGLAICMAAGRFWLDRFPTRGGRVLIIDLELQQPDITRRTRDIAAALHVPDEIVAENVEVISLRGTNATIEDIERRLLTKNAGTYLLVIIDPLYKVYPPDFDENSNAQMTLLYRRFERIAEHMKAGMVLIHHASKGSQAEKRVVDVGSGAGAQARSPDCHIALREHEEDGCIVFDARVRSFKPADAMVLRWEAPLWHRALDLDPTDLKTGRKSKDKPESQPEDKPEPWTPERFVAAFITDQPQGKTLIAAKARQAELKNREIDDLFTLAIAEKHAFRWTFADQRVIYLATVEQPITYKEKEA